MEKNKYIDEIGLTALVTELKDYIDSEGGKPIYINNVKLEDNKTSSDLEITWFGTYAEYLALESEGLINSETIYFVKDSEGDLPPEQRSYEALADKPQIDGVTLSGDKSAADLNIYTIPRVDNLIESRQPKFPDGESGIDYTVHVQDNEVELREDYCIPEPPEDDNWTWVLVCKNGYIHWEKLREY